MLSEKRIVILFSALVIFLAMGFGVVVHHIGEEAFWEFNFGDFMVAVGTIVLALFTAISGVVTQEERRRAREEPQKERRRMRLRELLEGLYAPLMSMMPDIERISSHGKEIIPVDLREQIQQFRAKSECLASDELKKQIAAIFRPDSETAHTEWDKFCTQFMNTIKMETEMLLKQYRELTS